MGSVLVEILYNDSELSLIEYNSLLNNKNENNQEINNTTTQLSHEKEKQKEKQK